MPKDYIVLSYDLVSDGAFVVEADICTRVPLPGSEGQDLEETEHGAQVVDVVVFALSLMSVNWVGAIREAWRVLKPEYALRFSFKLCTLLIVIGSVASSRSRKLQVGSKMWKHSHHLYRLLASVCAPRYVFLDALLPERNLTSLFCLGR